MIFCALFLCFKGWSGGGGGGLFAEARKEYIRTK